MPPSIHQPCSAAGVAMKGRTLAALEGTQSSLGAAAATPTTAPSTDTSDGISRTAPPLATVPAAGPALASTSTSAGRKLLSQRLIHIGVDNWKNADY